MARRRQVNYRTPKHKAKKAEVQKPKTADYRTNLFLYDMRGIDEQIFNIVKEFMERTKAFRYKELWAKYFIFLYLSGARRMEPFLSNPTVSKFEEEGEMYYRIRRVNEKHFEGRKPRRQLLSQLFKAWNKHEQALFEFLLGEKNEVALDFTPLIDPQNKHPEIAEHLQVAYNGRDELHYRIGAQISTRFAQLFKADITNHENEKVSNTGIVPHMLRHIRAYDLLIGKDLPEGLCAKLIGWKPVMLQYYADISRSMQEKEEMDIYKHLPKST